jgi:hypothetical protein
MWPWRKRVQESPDTQGTLGQRLADMEAEVRRIRLEWHDAFDRLDRIAGRLSKRAERAATAAAADAAATEGDPQEVAPPNGALAQVMRRRSGRVFPGRP